MSSSSEKAPIVIYAIPGSQFVFKVLTALESRRVPHYVEFVPMDTKQRTTILKRQDGKAQVPVLRTLNGGEEGSSKVEQIDDSEQILHWLDANYNTNYFPTQPASDVSVRASDKTLAAMVWYYNWVNHTGYSRSMKLSASKMVPFPAIFPGFLLDFALKSTRSKFRRNVSKVLEIDNDKVLDDEPYMRQILIKELQYFQDLLLKADDDQQPYLIPNTTEPTAADFSVYAQLERLVGGGDTVSDVPISPAILELKTEEPTKSSLSKLWKWHNRMRDHCPVHFKGKRPSKDILDQLQPQK